MNRFRVVVVPMIALVSLLIASCGSSSSNQSTTSEPTVPPETTTSIEQATTTAVATTTTIAPPPSVSMAFSGDVLIHSQLWTQAQKNNRGNGYDFSPMFARIKPLLDSVDFAVCHLEVPIAPPGEAPSTFPYYGAPRELIGAIAGAGYDRCSTASNHALDKGRLGIDTTLKEFDAAGITQSGMARTPEEIEPKIIKINGINVSHLSYAWGFNDIPLPRDEPWRAAQIDPARIIADAKKARSLGAQMVIVSMHWGQETVANVTGYQLKNAKAITASGLIDLVVGHHAHVVQKIEKINGIWTVFGLGNVLSNMPTRAAFPPNTQDGMIVTVKLTLAADGKVAVDKPRVHPTWVDKNNGKVIRLVKTDLLNATVSAAVKTQLRISLARTAKVVGKFIVAD
ncbi:MAG: CapA family protein [Ilumatobacteraceae bacterium]|nr:CapA family protein [Ilumatobacteraceae bacterium]